MLYTQYFKITIKTLCKLKVIKPMYVNKLRIIKLIFLLVDTMSIFPHVSPFLFEICILSSHLSAFIFLIYNLEIKRISLKNDH